MGPYRFSEGKRQDEVRYLAETWKALSEDRVRELAEKYNLSYVIREQSLPLDLPVAMVLKKHKLVIYDVSSALQERTTKKSILILKCRKHA